MKKETVITADIDYLIGHLKYGHYELTLNEEELERFKEMSEDEQEVYIKEYGEVLVDDYSITDAGSITDIKIHE